jgi:hypothetical protein
MLNHTYAFDFDPDHVAGLQELGPARPARPWVERHPDPARGPGQDQIPRRQRARLADELDHLPAAEDQVAGVAVLAELAVDPGSELQVARVGDLVGGRDPWTVGAERVGALSAGPLRLPALEVAGGDVVGDAVAGDLAAGAPSRSSARPRIASGDAAAWNG